MLKARASELKDSARQWHHILALALHKHRRLRLLDSAVLLRFVQHCALLNPHDLRKSLGTNIAERTLLPYILLW